ncbi:MAG TPA: DUF2917 domain-containing protein [Burkholderiales bacterium]|jgi:hypothetical protein|nr:DUF2917 domain-containing protein [Burkholderiales bacterium]
MREAIRHALYLNTGSVLKVCNGNRLRVEVTEGQAWITQEGDLRDHVLQAGQSWRIDRDGLTLIQALMPSRLALLAVRDRDRPEPKATFSLVLSGAI